MEKTTATPEAKPAPSTSWEAAPPLFDLGGEASKLGDQPVQNYGSSDPPPVAQPQPAPAPGEGAAPGAQDQQPGVTPKKQTREQAAKLTISFTNHLQKNIFAFFADEEDADRFAFDDELKGELADYLETGLEESGSKFRMPWWLPFGFVLMITLFANFRTMRKLRKEKREEAERKAAEQAERENGMEVIHRGARPPVPGMAAPAAHTLPPDVEMIAAPVQAAPPPEAVKALHQEAHQAAELVRSTKMLPKCAAPWCNFQVKKKGDKYCGKPHMIAHRQWEAAERAKAKAAETPAKPNADAK